MNRALIASSLVFAASFLATALQPAVVSAQTPPKTTQSKDAGKKKAALTAPQTHYDGTIPDVILLAKKSDATPSQFSLLYKQNIRQTFALAWNQNKAKTETMIRNYLTQQLGLYDVSVVLANASSTHVSGDSGKALYGSIDPASKTFTVKFFVPGHKMFARASVDWNFDPSVHGKFNLEVEMHFSTKGNANNPLVVTGSRINVVDFTSEVLDISIAGQAQSFSKAKFTDTVVAKHAANNLNGLLRIYTAQNGPIVTPYMRINGNDGNTGLVLEFSKASPALSNPKLSNPK